MTKEKEHSSDMNTCGGKSDENVRHTQGRLKGSVLLNYKFRMAGAEAVYFQSQ